MKLQQLFTRSEVASRLPSESESLCSHEQIIPARRACAFCTAIEVGGRNLLRVETNRNAPLKIQVETDVKHRLRQNAPLETLIETDKNGNTD